MALESLLQSPHVWRGSTTAAAGEAGSLPSGFPELDALLPARGWPCGTLVELLIASGRARQAGAGTGRREAAAVGRQGIGALSLLLPALAAALAGGRHGVLVAPPYVPYAPALEAAGVRTDRLLVVTPGGVTPSVSAPPPDLPGEALWAFEQVLASRGCGMAALWPSRRLSAAVLRRLKLAAARGGGIGVVYRSEQAADEASPAALRLKLSPVVSATGDQRLDIEIVKAQGSWAGGRCTVKLWPAR